MRRLTILVSVLALVAFACGDDDSATTTTVAPTTDAATTTAAPTTTTEAPTTTTAPTTTATPTTQSAAPDTIDLSDPTLYDQPEELSYRVTLFFDFVAETDDGTIEGRMSADGGRLLGPPEVHELTARAEGSATAPVCFEFHSTPGYVSAYDTLLDEGGYLIGEAQLMEAGLEVNGRTVNRYTVTIDNVDPIDAAGADVVEIGEAWVDIDAELGFVVSATVIGLGTSTLLSGDNTLEGDITYELNFSEFGEITELMAPEGC